MGNTSTLSPAATYQDILQVNAGGQGLQTFPLAVQDGLGTNTVMTLWKTGINFDRGIGQFQLDGVALTASAAVLNNLSNVAVANYVLVSANAQLPNASVLTAAAGITLVNAAPNYVITPSGELGGLQAITGTGITVRTGAGTYATRSIATDATLSIANSSGVVGNPTLGVISDTNIQRVNVQDNGVFQSSRSQLNFIPSTNVGITINDSPFSNRTDIIISATPGVGGVSSIIGTPNQINVSSPTGNVTISISPTYIGQTSITTLGTITTGTWNGSVIDLAHGGTNANLTASNGGIFYSTASAGAILAGTATANQVLLSGSSTTPAWSTATYPATTTINQLLYSSSANTIVGLTTANNGVLLTSAGGVPSIGTATVPVGGTGGTSFTAYAVITGGTTSTGNLQSVASVGTAGQVLTSNGAGALPTFQNVIGNAWIDQTSSPVTLVANSAYISDTVGLLTFNVPATVAQGVEFEIAGFGSGGWLVRFNTGQVGNLNSTATSSAGSFASTSRYDTIKLLCVVANTTFVVLRSSGSITVA